MVLYLKTLQVTIPILEKNRNSKNYLGFSEGFAWSETLALRFFLHTLPLLFGGGLLWEPLTLAIIFGLFFATIITLLFVPVVYRLLFKVSFKEYGFNRKRLEGGE